MIQSDHLNCLCFLLNCSKWLSLPLAHYRSHQFRYRISVIEVALLTQGYRIIVIEVGMKLSSVHHCSLHEANSVKAFFGQELDFFGS